MNAAAVLSLISDLYTQVQAQQAENEKLKEESAELRLKTIGKEAVPPDPLGGPEEADRAAREEQGRS